MKTIDPAYSSKNKKDIKTTKNIIIKIVVIIIALSIVILTIAPFIGIPLYVNRHVDYLGATPPGYPMQDIYYAEDYALDETQMYLETEDGFKVWASEIETQQPKGVIVYLTGIVQPSITYFYGHAKWMEEMGYASILLEVRGHGKSDGNQICLGYDEVADVKAAIQYIKSQERYEDVPIVLHGVSMGGAVAINSFGQLEEVDALIAMSAYSSFEDVAMDIADNYGVPKGIQLIEKPLVRSALKLVFGSNKVEHMKPIEQIKNTNGRPALLIACTGDTGVPVDSVHRLKEANPDVELWIRDSWEHFIVKDCDFINMAQDEEYCQRIISFLEDHLIGAVL